LSRARLALVASLLAVAISLPASRPARADGPTAEELIPFEKLEVDLRNELWRVTQRYTIRRSLEVTPAHCHLSTYTWLIGHLGLASTAVRKLRMGEYVIEDKAEGRFSIDDRDGAFASCERAFEERGRVVIVARGTVEGALLPRVHGTGVIVVRYREETDDERAERSKRERQDGHEPDPWPIVSADCRVFFRVDDSFLHLASTPFRRTLGRILGDKLDGLAQCAGKVSEVVDHDPRKVWDAIQGEKLPATEIEEFRTKFMVQ
jgi:hypothetical protein